jgi:hypothetical protein
MHVVVPVAGRLSAETKLINLEVNSMAGLWAIITGAGKVSEVVDTGLDLVKTGAKGLDMLAYTKEEQAIDGAKNIVANMDHALQFAKISQSESGASAVTRRIFGLIVLGNFTLFVILGLVALHMGKKVLVDDIIAFANAVSMGQLAITVIVSTFGYYAVTKNRP